MPGECLSEETVAALVARRLDPADAERAGLHLDRCPSCLEWVAQACLIEGEDEDRPGAPAVSSPSWAGRYRSRGVLGRGGMGVVHRAWDELLEREVALKVLRPSLVDSRLGVTERLIRESRVMAQLKHPNVVRVYDAGTDGEEFFVAMEYIHGSTLREWLLAQSRNYHAIVRCLLDAGRGLVAAHTAGIVHRDVKPDNVLIDESGCAMVTDFGLARVADHPTTDGDEATPPMPAQTGARTGVGAGTPAYMAPEQLKTGQVDRRADVFAFCVTAFEALLGRRPFPDAPAGARLEAIVAGRPTVDGSRRVPRRVRAAIVRGLAADPDARPESLEPLLRVLQSALTRRRRLVAASAGLIVLGGVAAGALWVPVSTPSPPCERPPDRLDELRSRAGAAELQQAFAAAGRNGLLDWSRLRPRVDGIAAELDRAWLAACSAGRGGGRSPAHVAVEQACLVERRHTAAALLQLVLDGDPDAVEDVVEVGTPASCAAEALEVVASGRAGLHPEAREELAALIALSIAAADDELRARGLPFIEQMREAGEKRGEAIALRRVAEAEYQTDAQTGVRRAEQAGDIAEEIEAHSLAASAWISAANMAARQREYERARNLLKRATVSLERVQPPAVRGRLEVRSLLLSSVLALPAGEPEEARRHLEKAAMLSGQHATDLMPFVISGRASLEKAEGNLDLAIELQREYMRYVETRDGPRSHRVLTGAWNLAQLLATAGKLVEAKAAIERAAASADQWPQNAAGVHTAAAWIHLKLGELDAARASADEVERLRRGEVGAARRGDLLRLRSAIERLDGNLAAARELAEQARSAVADLAKEEPRASFAADVLLASILGRQGEVDRGIELVRPAYERERANRPHAVSTGRAATTLGWLLMARPETRGEALELFRSAAPLLPNPYQRAWADYGQAAALVATGGARDQALALARVAERTLAELPRAQAHELSEIRGWLAREDR